MTSPVNWLLLAEVVVVVIAASAFLFYWNRLLGSVFAFLLRLFVWRYHNAYVSIGSLQISPLAGRIAFRDVEYHSSNMSVRALHGHITWRYWKLRVRQESDTASSNIKRSVEGFIYNRTPAYDAIVERMKKHEAEESPPDTQTSSTTEKPGTRARLRKQKTLQKDDSLNSGQERSSSDTHCKCTDKISPDSVAYPPKPLDPLHPLASAHELSSLPKPPARADGVDWFREALPLELRIVTGSFVLGSDATPMVLIADFKGAEGVIEMTDSRSQCDLNKTSYAVNFTQPKVLMRTNADYTGPLLAHGKKVYDELFRQNPDVARMPPSTISTEAGFHFLAKRFPFLFNPKFSQPPVAGLPTDRMWKGLARYRHVDSYPNKRDDWEYAKVTTLLDSPSVDFTYYADTPGLVPYPHETTTTRDQADELGNIEPSPEYGIDIVIHGGIVKYGPWADRQRSFDAGPASEIGRIGSIKANGSYRYYTTPSPDHQETLTLHLEGNQVIFKALGWAVRRMFCVKDNYFGGFTEYRTEAEWTDKFDTQGPIGDDVEAKYRPGRVNEIYGFKSGIVLPVPQLQLSLKSVEQFMDLVAAYEAGVAPAIKSRDAVFLEANRLFGPPPKVTTYLCLWEAVIPRVTAFVTPSLLATLQGVAAAVGYNYSDHDNAPSSVYQVKTPPDVTFLKLSIGEIVLAYITRDSAVTVDLPLGVSLDLSTLASRSHLSSFGVLLPTISISILQYARKWTSVGRLSSGLAIDMYEAPKNWKDKASKQQAFLKEQDVDTKRIWYMYEEEGEDVDGKHNHGLYLRHPRASAPDESDSDDESDLSGDSTAPVSSSPESSDMENPYEGAPFKRRATVSAAAQDLSSDLSIGDESDSVSTASSSGSSVSDRPFLATDDMAEALAARLARLRSRVPRRFFSEPSLPTEKDEKPLPKFTDLTANHGTVFRVTVCEAMQFDLCPSSISAIMEVVSATTTRVVMPDVDAASPGTKIVDLVAPSTSIRISNSTSEFHRSIYHLDLQLQEIAGGLSISPPEPGEGKSTSLTSRLTCQSMAMQVKSAEKYDLSLLDIGEFSTNLDTPPLLRLKVERLNVDLKLDPRHKRIHGKLSTIDLQAVTEAIPILASSVSIWQAAVEEITIPETAPTEALVLYCILKSALSVDDATSRPGFFHEGAYGLHIRDGRGIRRDLGWTLLCRFRQWQSTGRVTSDDLATSKSKGEMARFVVEEIVRLDESTAGDEDYVKQQRFLKKAFGEDLDGETPPDVVKTERIAVFASVESVLLRHYGRLLESGGIVTSTLQVGAASLGCQLQDFHRAEPVIQIRAVVAVRNIEVEIRNSIFPAAGAILRAVHVRPHCPTAQPRRNGLVIVADVHLGSAMVAMDAGDIRARVTVRGAEQSVTLQSSATGPAASSRFKSISSVDLVEAALLELPDGNRISTSSDKIVLSARIEGAKVVLDSEVNSQGSSPLRLLVGIKFADFESRPQLRPLYLFSQEWKKQQYPYPIADQIQSFIASDPKPDHTAPDRAVVLDVKLVAARLQICAAQALWLRWDIGEIYGTRQGSRDHLHFGVRVAEQMIGAYSTPHSRKTKSLESASFRLPSISALGNHQKLEGLAKVTSTIDIGFFTGVLKPALLDRLLTLHQRLGADIMEVIGDYQASVSRTLKSRRSQGLSVVTVGNSPEPTPKHTLRFDMHILVAGVRFGLRANDVLTTLLFEALALEGNLTNATTPGAALLWSAKVDHFGLSLGHLGTSPLSIDSEPMRKSRSAYMVFDLNVQEIPSTGRSPSELSVSLNRVHTVMHVAALGELTDLFKSWSADLTVLSGNRAAEVAEVKSHTTRVLKKMESAEKKNAHEASWLATRLLRVEVTGIGIAIPLADGAAIDLEQKEDSTVPAMLFSIRVIKFTNRKNETARFKIQQMALQFLQNNRMVVPSIDAEAQMSTNNDVWSFSAHCSATDFKLTLAADVAEGIFQLIDLYEKGRERLSDLEQQYRIDMAKLETFETLASKYEADDPSPVSHRPSQKIKVMMSFTFNSGIVELHRPLSDVDKRLVASDLRGRTARVGTHDSFHLPTISVYVTYAEASSDILESKVSGNDAGILLVNTSSNILRPSILPFFVDIVNRIEARLKHEPASSGPSELKIVIPDSETITLPLEPKLLTPAIARAGKVRIRVTLRIDRSELRLSCAPDSNAFVDLKWESGGFLFTMLKGGKDVTSAAGTISGVTVNLSHEFAEQGRSCVEAGARDMSFSVAHSPSIGIHQGGLSIVLDTQISAKFRLDAFSAWLILTSVWLDNAPKLDIPLRAGMVETQAPPTSPRPRSKLKTAALVRIRKVDFDAYIGVTTAKLEISPVVLRVLSNGETTELDVQVGVTQVVAHGDISGDIKSESLKFNTVRRSARASATTDPTVLELSILGGELSGNMFIQNTNIARFHLEPLTVTLADDWKAFSLDPTAQVFLAFAVKAGEFQGVLRLLAIPQLLGNFYAVFDMVESQHKIAAQRSDTFKLNEARKSSEPSPVANVMLRTAQRAGTSTTTSSYVKTAQTMRFDLGGIDVGIFNEDFEEGHVADFYRFMVGKVEADLKRQMTKEGLPRRDLSLLVTSVRWDTSDGARAAAGEKRTMTARGLIDMAKRYGRREVASLPLMTLTMGSVEYPDPPVLEYDFDLIWGETDGDVAILPNFFEQAYNAVRKLAKGLDEQALARSRRLGIEILKPITKEEEENESSVENALVYRRREKAHMEAMPIPRLKLLGEGTTDAAKLVPKIKSAVNELPNMSHRFVTLPLEDGMDLLLGLYEKQLPAQNAAA
ncbi:protein CSF1, partial [Tremellales sp. Uapishka_1]